MSEVPTEGKWGKMFTVRELKMLSGFAAFACIDTVTKDDPDDLATCGVQALAYCAVAKDALGFIGDAYRDAGEPATMTADEVAAIFESAQLMQSVAYTLGIAQAADDDADVARRAGAFNDAADQFVSMYYLGLTTTVQAIEENGA